MSTKLGDYITRNRLTNKMFARMMAEYFKRDTFSERTVETWRAGHTLPRGRNLEAIAFVTNGEVTANDFVNLPEQAE